MDTRAELLLEELSTHPEGQDLDFPYWRKRFQRLFAEQIDDNSRIGLLEAYTALLNLVERSINDASSKEKFLAARETDWRFLCIQEAKLRNGGGQMHPHDMNEIVTREVEAARMANSEYTQMIADMAATYPDDPAQSEGKKGFFTRLFR